MPSLSFKELFMSTEWLVISCTVLGFIAGVLVTCVCLLPKLDLMSRTLAQRGRDRKVIIVKLM